MEDKRKYQTDLRFENADLKFKCTKVTYEFEIANLQYSKLEKYNTIVKGEITQTKQYHQKIYSNSQKIDEKTMTQRHEGDMSGIGYVEGVRPHPDPS
jgi:hypothetical protein